MLTSTTLKFTPLNDVHCSLKAKMVPFGGWNMPLQYEGILAEYEHTRRGVTVFDTSHMGEFFLEGDYAKSGLDRIVTMALKDLPLKTCRYGVMLNQKGGIIDDLIVYRLAPQKWMLVVNAATMDNDARHFQEHLTANAVFTNASSKTGKLDIQGPLAREVFKKIVPGIEKLEYYTFDFFKVLGENVVVSRTGYTGELGYEIYFPWERTKELWDAIFKDSRVKPAGLGVRDVLRIEMGYSLYGQDIDATISPLEAGLNKFVDLEKNFIGQEALLKEKEQGLKRKMACFASAGRRAPRHHFKIYSPDLQEIGVVTSGTFSPGLTRGIGMGFVRPDAAKIGQKILFGDHNNKIEGELTARPFYKSGSLKS